MRGRCVICTSPFFQNNCAALICGHTFHLTCILQWLERSKTCPHCREKTSERQIVRQLFFDAEETLVDGQTSFASDGANGSGVNIESRVNDLEAALDAEKTDHSKTKETLRSEQGQVEKLNALLKREKDKGKALAKSEMGLRDHIACLERTLQDNQDAKRQVDKYRARLKVAEFYKLLLNSSVDDAEKAIDNYLGESNDLDGPKFLSLIRRQLEDTRRRLSEANQRAQRSDSRVIELEAKVKRLSKLVVSLREEVNVHRGSVKSTPYNPYLKDILADTPESSERSLLESQAVSSPLTFEQLSAHSRPRLPVSVRTHSPPTFSLNETNNAVTTATTEEGDWEEEGNMSLHVALPGRYHLSTARRRSSPTLTTSDGLGGHRRPFNDVNPNNKRLLPKKPPTKLKKHKSGETSNKNQRISTFFVRKPATSATHVVFLD
uniref:RING-type domain-containing protein n=1 Tax=Plectus sambesii TaxID=2011161 RepID=A0A914XKP6_9BILA